MTADVTTLNGRRGARRLDGTRVPPTDAAAWLRALPEAYNGAYARVGLEPAVGEG